MLDLKMGGQIWEWPVQSTSLTRAFRVYGAFSVQLVLDMSDRNYTDCIHMSIYEHMNACRYAYTLTKNYGLRPRLGS
jgi:hypothetical protein